MAITGVDGVRRLQLITHQVEREYLTGPHGNVIGERVKVQRKLQDVQDRTLLSEEGKRLRAQGKLAPQEALKPGHIFEDTQEVMYHLGQTPTTLGFARA